MAGPVRIDLTLADGTVLQLEQPELGRWLCGDESVLWTVIPPASASSLAPTEDILPITEDLPGTVFDPEHEEW